MFWISAETGDPDMTGSLTVRFSPDQEFVVAAAEPLPAADAARQWLDEQFLEFDCEPLLARQQGDNTA
jgi:hypothetical protein